MVDEVLRVLANLDRRDDGRDPDVPEVALGGSGEAIREKTGGRWLADPGGHDDQRPGRGGVHGAHRPTAAAPARTGSFSSAAREASTALSPRAAATRGWTGASGMCAGRPIANS